MLQWTVIGARGATMHHARRPVGMDRRPAPVPAMTHHPAVEARTVKDVTMRLLHAMTSAVPVGIILQVIQNIRISFQIPGMKC